jgi:hypothetical protein
MDEGKREPSIVIADAIRRGYVSRWPCRRLPAWNEIGLVVSHLFEVSVYFMHSVSTPPAGSSRASI